MAAFTAKDVMALREQTDAGMMDCKRALTDADGDMKKAAELLRERGIAKAAKRAGKIAAEGLVHAYVSGDTGVLIEVNCESDFVAAGEKFVSLVETVAKLTAEKKPANLEALLALDMGGKTVETYLQEQTGIIGEKISVRRFVCFKSAGLIETYIHLGGKRGVMLNFEGAETPETKELAHNVALHVAFATPQYLAAEDVPAEVVEHEKEILKKEVINEGKPEAIAEKIVLGKIKKFYEDNCLLEQKYVRDDSVTIKQLIANVAKTTPVSLKEFCCFIRGEGIEKKEEDLSEEVAKQVEAMRK